MPVGPRRQPEAGKDGTSDATECPDQPAAPGEAADEVLEQLWLHGEVHAGAAMPDGELLARLPAPGSASVLAPMVNQGLIRREDGAWRIGEQGLARAREIIRRHRLAERLFTDVLEMSPEMIESNACSFEHAISPEVAEHICTLLGHPSSCPHGHPIPPGPCCEHFRTDTGPIVVPLSRLDVGTAGRVAYIVAHNRARLDRLAALGLVPGAEMRLRQRRPSYILTTGETQIALDEETAREFYIRPKRGK